MDNRNVRILLVEDEARVAGFIAKGLREQAYAVDIAPDGTIYMAGFGQNGLPSANGYFGGTSDAYLIIMK